jgi:hypothetical protein
VTGVGQHPWIIRAFGIREITAGVGLLALRSKKPWLYFRLAGDVVDVTAMSLAMTSKKARRGRIAAATAAVAPIVVMDAVYSLRSGERNNGRSAEGGAFALPHSGN